MPKERLAAAALLGIAGSTTVGPDFVAPEPDPPPEWSQPLGAGIEAAPGELSEWWRVFGDPVLEDLLAEAIRLRQPARLLVVVGGGFRAGLLRWM